MRVFLLSCVDKETGHDMVLSECSYNAACRWLMDKGFTDPTKTSITDGGRYTTLTFTQPKERTFVYDELRGYLLATR